MPEVQYPLDGLIVPTAGLKHVYFPAQLVMLEYSLELIQIRPVSLFFCAVWPWLAIHIQFLVVGAEPLVFYAAG